MTNDNTAQRNWEFKMKTKIFDPHYTEGTEESFCKKYGPEVLQLMQLVYIAGISHGLVSESPTESAKEYETMRKDRVNKFAGFNFFTNLK